MATVHAIAAGRGLDLIDSDNGTIVACPNIEFCPIAGMAAFRVALTEVGPRLSRRKLQFAPLDWMLAAPRAGAQIVVQATPFGFDMDDAPFDPGARMLV